MSSSASNPLNEIDAMGKVTEALEGLDEEEVARVIRWAADRYKVDLPKAAGVKEDTEEINEYKNVADFFVAANPKLGTEKALVVGYWFQVIGGWAEFDARSVNSELKNLGHGLSNVTTTLTGLISRKPQLVMQTKKKGSSKQAQKRYKLTNEGKSAVEEMIKSA